MQEGGPPYLLLDACCLLNLCATQRITEILQSLPRRFEMAENVMAEVNYVRRGGEGEDADELDPIELQPLVDIELLDLLHLQGSNEERSFVNFSADLGDGEAMTLAIALHRNRAVATDDRKAARIAHEHAIPVISTLEIIRQWSEDVALSTAALRQILINLHERGRYLPARSHPLHPWWERNIANT